MLTIWDDVDETTITTKCLTLNFQLKTLVQLKADPDMSRTLDRSPSCVFLHMGQHIFSTRLCPLPAPPPSPMILGEGRGAGNG